MLLALAAAFLSAAMAAPPSAPYHALDSNDGGAASYQNGHALGETQQEGFAPPVRQSQPTIVVGGQQQQAEQSQPLLQDSHAPPSHAEPLAHVPPAASAAASVQETSTSALDAPDPANKLCGVDKNLIRNYWSCFLFFSWRLNSAFLSINNYKTFSSSPSSDQTKLANKVGPFYIGSVLAPIIIYGACIYCCIRLFRGTPASASLPVRAGWLMESVVAAWVCACSAVHGRSAGRARQEDADHLHRQQDAQPVDHPLRAQAGQGRLLPW